MGRLFQIFALLILVGVPAPAEDTIALYGDDDGNGLSRSITVGTGTAFDVVVLMKSDAQSAGL